MVSLNFVVFFGWNVNIKLVVLCFYMDFLTLFFIPVLSFSQIYFVRMFSLARRGCFSGFINNRQTCVLQ